jgi:hypothetical protein
MKRLIEHADAIGVGMTFIASIIGSMLWMNAQFNHIDDRFASMEYKFETRFSAIEKDIAIIKTVLIMKEIMPHELASNEK